MDTRADLARMLTIGHKQTFEKSYKDGEQLFPKLTTEIVSTSDGEDYSWLGESGEMREFKDERVSKAFKEYGFRLQNKKWENTLTIDWDLIEDESYGTIDSRVKGLASRSRKSYDTQLTIVIEANGLCYDGQNFFDTDHVDGDSGIQSNVNASGAALTADNLKSIITKMEAFKDDTGQCAEITPTHIMVPTALKWTAIELLDPAAVAVSTDPADAVLKGKLKIIVNKKLANDGANSVFYVLDLESRGLKPWVYQNRKELKFTEDLSELFKRDKISYGVRARFAFGYGDWRQAFRSQGGS